MLESINLLLKWNESINLLLKWNESINLLLKWNDKEEFASCISICF